jgi:PAS domain S-box-containing protein
MDQWRNGARGDPVTYEMRWKKTPNKQQGSGDDARDYLWTLTACVPIKADDGTVTGIFGCSTDISAQKEATRTALRRTEAERRLANFTETAPVGVYQCDSNLNMEYCNYQWFGIIGHPKVPLEEIDWRSTIHEEDLESIANDTKIVMNGEDPHTFSFRCKKIWTSPDGVSTLTWILATATRHVDKGGKVDSIIGTLTDVSQLKWAEAMQKTRVEEALESKRQQENFIDMTSHEMRMLYTHSSRVPRC